MLSQNYCRKFPTNLFKVPLDIVSRNPGIQCLFFAAYYLDLSVVLEQEAC